MSTYFKLLALLRPYARRVAGAVILSTATVASSIGLLGLSAYLIAHAALHPSIAELQTTIVGVRVFGISRGIFRYLERLVSHDVNFKLVSKLRVHIFDVLEPLTPAVLGQRQSSDFFNRIVRDVDSLDHFYVRVISPMWTAIFITAGMSIFLGLTYAETWLPFLIGMLASGFFLPIFAYWIGSVLSPKISERHNAMAGIAVTALQGMPELLVYNGSERVKCEWAREQRSLSAVQRRTVLLSATIDGLNNLIMTLTMTAVLAVGIMQISRGVFDAVNLPILVVLVLASFEAVLPLGQAAQFLSASKEAGNRLINLEGLTPAVTFGGNSEKASTSAIIKIENLTFRYPDSDKDAIQDIDLEILEGEKVAIIGPSGSGKTTIGRLLLRYWDPSKGYIQLSDVNLNELPELVLRRSIAIVPQNPYIFSNSLRQNLIFGEGNFSDSELVQKLVLVGLHTWYTKLPRGLDTWLGEHGSMMSGGERQRLCIARTLLREAKVNIFDEPTANLDPENARSIRDLLHSRFHGTTQIWITHDFSGLERMDRIVVLENGVIQEMGSPDSLITKDGYYARLLRQNL
ncbi:MAG TPA: thiol reductant ABC exporter subunit CydC [Bellilinea sp.]|nr:thiol reductant ABC exporter subunit CydC [Bellilinea sp.]